MPRITVPVGFTPRPYQLDFLTNAISLIESNPTTPHLFSSPTGTGKTWMILLLMERYPDSICVTPRIEIICGFLEKLGHYIDNWKLENIVEFAWKQYGIITPIRLRSKLARGDLGFGPSLLILDECHHSIAESWEDISLYLNGIPIVGLTATPYRGTPKGTQTFLEQWNNTVNEVLNLRDAVELGAYKIPKVTFWPMLDDDLLEVSNGEFKITAVDSLIESNTELLASRMSQFYCRKSRLWDVPTIVALPSSKSVEEVYECLTRHNLPCVAVTQATARKIRQQHFERTTAQTHILLQIDVISEGVDLPIQRVVDLKPTMSPVRWMQQIGRIRPHATYAPSYICCNRNIERHGYLMEGMLPLSTFVEAQEIFKKPSKRSGSRGVGLEGVGKFKSIPLKLKSGLTIECYNLVSVNQFEKTEYMVVVHPQHPAPLFGKRNIRIVDGKLDYMGSRWGLLDNVSDLSGFSTGKKYPTLTDKQLHRWNSDAESYGLDSTMQTDNCAVQVMIFL